MEEEPAASEFKFEADVTDQPPIFKSPGNQPEMKSRHVSVLETEQGEIRLR